MKFLVDAQLPPKMCSILENDGFDALHVNSLPDGDETTDQFISTYADEHDLMVITKDSDFYYSHMIRNKPEKLLLITTGNIKNNVLFDLIRKNAPAIRELTESCNFIELTKADIVGHT